MFTFVGFEDRARGAVGSRSGGRILVMVISSITVALSGAYVLSATRSVDVSALHAPTIVDRYFSECGSIRANCVVDGDTLWIDEKKIRLADIDTPEISSPRCAGEEVLGQTAKVRLIELLNAGPFVLVNPAGPDVDRYGRELREVHRDGRSLGNVLVAEGLANRWEGRRLSWCNSGGRS